MSLYGPQELVDGMRTVRRNTILIAEDIPENKYGYRPTPDSRSVAYGEPSKQGSGWDTLHVESATGTGGRVLGSSGGWDIVTDWTPDGSAIVWRYIEGCSQGRCSNGTNPTPHHTIVQRLDGKGTWHLDDYTGP